MKNTFFTSLKDSIIDDHNESLQIFRRRMKMRLRRFFVLHYLGDRNRKIYMFKVYKIRREMKNILFYSY
jgi:hypothetical protein